MIKKHKTKNYPPAGKLKTKQKGYTIIELLAVISILVIISGIVSGILYSTLRGTNKTKITTEVSQNGAYALSVITNDIIDSGSVTQIDGVDVLDCTAAPTGTAITLKRLDGTNTVLSCSGNTISQDGKSLVNSNTVSVTSCTFSCSQKSDDSYSIPSVGINFTIQQKSGNFAEQKSSSTFNTSVTMRNYTP